MRISKRAGPASIGLSVALGLGCSAGAGGSGDQMGNLQGSGGAMSLGSGGDTALPPAGGSGALGSGGAMFLPGTGGVPGGDPNAPDACAATSQAAEEIIVEVPVEIEEKEPIAFFIMQDRSSSMVGVAGNPNGWNEASGAVNAFVMDPDSAGLDVALAFFPPLTAAASCDGSSCGVPAVPMGRLPQNAMAITSAMQGATPPVFPILITPTECALRGMIEQCKLHTMNTGEKCVAILVTDGAPTECNGDPAVLSQIAADGKAAGVLTFTLGMTGANFAVLNAIAQGGGTDCDGSTTPELACNVQSGQQAFIDALNAIRTTVVRTETRTETQSTKLDCEWSIPPAPENETFDKNKVNVEFTADGVPKQRIGAVAAESACATVQGGWYYDNPDAPAKVKVCPDTCDIIKGSNGARIDILLGCETVFSDPR